MLSELFTHLRPARRPTQHEGVRVRALEGAAGPRRSHWDLRSFLLLLTLRGVFVVVLAGSLALG